MRGHCPDSNVDILAFTDTHGDEALESLQEPARQADIAICAGDITTMGHDIDTILESIDNLPCQTYVIPGNHEDPQALKNMSLLLDNITYLHQQILDVNNYHLLGYGGEGFSFITEAFETFVTNTPIPQNNIILVTHQPPHNTALDKVNGRHTGNNSFRKFIDAHNVILSLSGHIHENFEVTDTVDNVKYMNPGPNGLLLTV